ncbi:hypothetical protein INT46_009013 [Mucor plumbeus]|uniref:Tc1-like transposase DDE domain-containing protein n=1 Tax=Mucor plumbeus TaxID=97098 RepID=A0A8H7V1N3_9FUNG|nr:hypothetical protein INT46_009013 [Mucor plumbeus]
MVSRDNKKVCLAWAKAHRHYTVTGCRNVSFYWSDKPGTIQPHQTTTKVQNNGGGVMFWGCITADGPGYGKIHLCWTLSIIMARMHLTLDFNKISPPHKSDVTRDWFDQNGISADETLDWPTQSSDLNPIEHVWFQLKQRLDNYMTKPTTKEELANRISVEWDKITQKECLRYIDSMPSIIEAVIKSNGGPTSF